MAAEKRVSWIVCGVLLATLIAAGIVIRSAAPEINITPAEPVVL